MRHEPGIEQIPSKEAPSAHAQRTRYVSLAVSLVVQTNAGKLKKLNVLAIRATLKRKRLMEMQALVKFDNQLFLKKKKQLVFFLKKQFFIIFLNVRVS